MAIRPRGSQSLSIRYTKRLADAGGVTSIGLRRDSYDNAMSPARRSRRPATVVRTRLRGIELGLFDTAQGAEALFLAGSALADDMSSVINNWQSATGERVKERPVGTVVPGSGQPLRIPVPGLPAPAAPSPNGSTQAPATRAAAASTASPNGQAT